MAVMIHSKYGYEPPEWVQADARLDKWWKDKKRRAKQHGAFCLEKNKEEAIMNFGEAIKALKLGKRVARKGWNGEHQFIFLVDGDLLSDAVGYTDADLGNSLKDCSDALAIYTSNKVVQVGWLASQTDMLANDWVVAE